MFRQPGDDCIPAVFAMWCEARAYVSIKCKAMNEKLASFAHLVRNVPMPTRISDDQKLARNVNSEDGTSP